MLIIFLKQVFVEHGVESLSFLSKTHNPDTLTIKQIIKNINPSNKKLKPIINKEFGIFFDSNSPERIQFLTTLIDKAFQYLTTVIAPELHEKLKSQIAEKIIYLDTSAIYRLFGLQGDYRKKVMVGVINICNSYSLSIKVNPKTQEELKSRLEFDANQLKKYNIPTNLRNVGLKYLTTENYLSTYWKDSKNTGISVDDFIKHYKHIKDILNSYNIEVECKSRVRYEYIKKSCDEYLSKIFNFAQDNNYDKSDSASEHDAYQIALIKKLRGSNCDSFLDCNTWFLTTDKFIIKMQKTDNEMKNELPIAMLPSQLLQILRFSTTSNMNYNDTFVHLFSTTINSSESISINDKAVPQILGRIAKYKATPELAEKILSDTYFLNKFSTKNNEGEKEELIHEEITKQLQETVITNKNLSEALLKSKGEFHNFKDSSNQKYIVLETESKELTSENLTLKEENTQLINKYNLDKKYFIISKLKKWKLEFLIPLVLTIISFALLILYFAEIKTKFNLYDTLFTFLETKYNFTKSDSGTLMFRLLIPTFTIPPLYWLFKSVSARFFNEETMYKKKKFYEEYYDSKNNPKITDR